MTGFQTSMAGVNMPASITPFFLDWGNTGCSGEKKGEIITRDYTPRFSFAYCTLDKQ